MGIPLAVFVGAFSTILLPHFSRISTYAPKRLSFYLLESTKFVFWVTLPATIIMSFLSEKIFVTLFLSKNFTVHQVEAATWVFIAYMAGLFAFSLNKILLNIFYSLHNTSLPAMISVIGMGSNLLLNFVLMPHFSTMGLALATTSAGFIQTMLYVVFLRIKFDFKFFYRNFARFVSNYVLQLLVVLGSLRLLYAVCVRLLVTYAGSWQHFFLDTVAFWGWVGPLCALGVWVLMRTRRYFGVDLYFLN
jgi:putative peptidoglycan lipid II flippase